LATGETRAAGWTDQIGPMLRLGLPLAAAQLAQLAINTTDTVLIGWLGARELAAAVLVGQAYFIMLMLGSGFLFAVVPIAAQAEGRGDVRGVRRAVRMGLWFALAFATLAMLPLWQVEPFYRALGQDPEVAALAGSYMRGLQWSLYPGLLVLALRSFLTARGFGATILWATLAGVALNALVAYALIFGHFGAPPLGLAGAAIAAMVSSSLIVAILAWAIATRPGLRDHEIFSRFWRPDWPAMAELLRLGWPISATILAEITLFAAASIMVGWFGPEQLAAHGIALQLASIAFMVPLGLSSAATVLVGQAAGRGDSDGVRAVAGAAIAIATAFAAAGISLFIALPRPLVAVFLDESRADAAAVAEGAVTLVAIAAAFQFFDSLQVTAVGLLRGVKDTRLPMMIAALSYWGLGMPAGMVFALPLGLGAPGVWIGLATGLAFAAVLLTWRFLRIAYRPAKKGNQAESPHLAPESFL